MTRFLWENRREDRRNWLRFISNFECRLAIACLQQIIPTKRDIFVKYGAVNAPPSCTIYCSKRPGMNWFNPCIPFFTFFIDGMPFTRLAIFVRSYSIWRVTGVSWWVRVGCGCLVSDNKCCIPLTLPPLFLIQFVFFKACIIAAFDKPWFCVWGALCSS